MLAAAVLGSSIALLDATIVTLALPTLGRELGAGFAGLQWTVNGYTLTLSALLLLGGSLGDRFGRRRIFLVGVSWFGLASLACGLAPNIAVLVAARLLQGVGGALLTPGSLALISATFGPKDRGRAIGLWAGLGGVATAAGPFVGGLLVPVSWRLVFLVNPPLCAVVVLLARRHVPESRDPAAAPRLDLAGAALAAAGLAGVTYALTAARGAGSVAAGLGGTAALVAFVVVERHSRAPMVPPQVFTSRQFTGANLVTFVVYAALGAVSFLLVVDLQVVGGYPPLAAGVALLPITVLMLTLSPLTGALSQRIGPRLPMSVGPLVCAAGTLLLRDIGPRAAYLTEVLPGVAVFGLGLATTVTPLTVTVLAAVPGDRSGLASGINNAVARTGSLLAVAVLPVAAGLGGRVYQSATAFRPGFATAMLLAAALLAGGGVLAAALIDTPERPAPDPTGAAAG